MDAGITLLCSYWIVSAVNEFLLDITFLCYYGIVSAVNEFLREITLLIAITGLFRQ